MNFEQNSLIVKAYAKVNLILQVLKKRADGFHDVNTVLQSINLADTLTFKQSSYLSLKSNSDIAMEDNLVIKAARLLNSYAKTNKGANITLQKHIPVKAGLGGGSSDAAATLLALNNLWGLNLKNDVLYVLGSQLGSDVNFFLNQGCALATNRGEKIKPLYLPMNLELVIAKPDFGISAEEAYLYWDKRNKRKEKVLESKIIEKINKREFFNDLGAPVIGKYPQYEIFFDKGYKAGAKQIMLSGSGSAFFAIVEEKTQNKVYEVLKEEGLSVYKAKTIKRSVEIIEG